jgi:hypothetical protein
MATILTHPNWHTGPTDLAHVGESELEAILHANLNRRLKGDLYYDGVLLMRKHKVLDRKYCNRVLRYYQNRTQTHHYHHPYSHNRSMDLSSYRSQSSYRYAA